MKSVSLDCPKANQVKSHHPRCSTGHRVIHPGGADDYDVDGFYEDYSDDYDEAYDAFDDLDEDGWEDY